MFKTRYLVVVAITAYLVFLLARLPAAWFAPYVDKALAQQGLRLTSVGGTVWSGRADLRSQYPALAPLEGSQLVWALRLGGLWKGLLRMDFQINGGAAQLQGQVQAGWKQIGLTETSGEISAMLLNSLLVNSLKVSQPLKLSRLSVHLKRTANPSITASGGLFWPQGTVVLAQNPGQTLSMPDMIANLSSINSGMQLIAKAQDESVLTITVDAYGMATITILQRMLSVLGRANNVSDPESTLLELQQKVF